MEWMVIQFSEKAQVPHMARVPAQLVKSSTHPRLPGVALSKVQLIVGVLSGWVVMPPTSMAVVAEHIVRIVVDLHHI